MTKQNSRYGGEHIQIIADITTDSKRVLRESPVISTEWREAYLWVTQSPLFASALSVCDTDLDAAREAILSEPDIASKVAEYNRIQRFEKIRQIMGSLEGNL
jgi:hypothetical protein